MKENLIAGVPIYIIHPRRHTNIAKCQSILGLAIVNINIHYTCEERLKLLCYSGISTMLRCTWQYTKHSLIIYLEVTKH